MSSRTHVRACIALALLIAPVTLFAQQKVQLPARDKLLTEKPAVIYSIGAEDGNDWELLSGVRGVAFDASDQLYVLDGNNFRVLVFDASGKFVRRISQKGEGPGELMAPTGMTVMMDGTIVVCDPGRRVYSLFKSDGTFLRNMPFGEGEGAGGRENGLHPHPRGGIIGQVFPLRQRDPNQLGAPTGERKVPVKWLDFGPATAVTTASAANVTKASQLYEFTLPSITPKVEERGRGVSVTTMPANWTPPAIFGVLPNGGLVVAHEAAYRVEVVSPAGKVERIVERPIPPRKGTEKDKETFVKRESENMSRGTIQTRGGNPSSAGPSVTRLEELVRNAPWMEVIPELRRVVGDPQGRIWVARTPPDFGALGQVDLLRADGAYIGTIANAIVPGAVSRTGRAAFIERDNVGVERVTVKSLPATWK